jgi:hypothetical protein
VLLRRYDTTNLFHFSEDLVMTFISLFLLQRTEPDAGKPRWGGTARCSCYEMSSSRACTSRVVAVCSGAAGWGVAQLVVADQLPVGPFLEVWEALFSAHPVRFLAKVWRPWGTASPSSAVGSSPLSMGTCNVQQCVLDLWTHCTASPSQHCLRHARQVCLNPCARDGFKCYTVLLTCRTRSQTAPA